MSEHTITELLSPAFLSRMQNMLGDEYESFLKSYEAPRTYGLRVNTAKISCDEFERIVPFPVTPIPWISNGYFYPEDVRPSFCPLYQAGLFYLQEKLLKEWDSRKIYDEEIHEILTERFAFRYPFEYLKDLPVKVSVSELKKRSWRGEEEKEESLFYEPDIQEIIPTFVSGEKEEYRGAARGTAYHRLMECLDYTHAEDVHQIQKQIRMLTDGQCPLVFLYP